ncbi:MAG TPA: glycosyltransferase, partial [Pirellula sp.]|nr:glycosyltransferase [Pirellula sp.]
SLIIIGRNEEQAIGKCIEAALESCIHLPDAEVLFVDSMSTDRTVEIASKYPIDILQLHHGQKRSPAAGRYLGYKHARGKYLFFVDGDSTVDPQWTSEGIAFLDDHPEYAGVAGRLDVCYVNSEGVAIGGVDNFYDQDLNQEIQDFPVLCGLSMYRKSAMDLLGSFNPYLPTGEEGEVGLRLRRAGWKLARLSIPMATENTDDRNTFYEVFRRLRTSFYDYGIVMRYAATYGGGLQYAWEQTRFVVTTFLGLILFALFSICAIYFNSMYWIPLLFVFTLMATIIRKGGFKEAMLSNTIRFVSLYCTLRSAIFTPLLPVSQYPTDAIRIKDASDSSSLNCNQQ